MNMATVTQPTVFTDVRPMQNWQRLRRWKMNHIRQEIGWYHDCPMNGVVWTPKGSDCKWCGESEK